MRFLLAAASSSSSAAAAATTTSSRWTMFTVLCVLLFLSPSHPNTAASAFNFGRGNNDKNKRNKDDIRRRLSEEETHVDVDAATGTVTAPAEAASATAGTACDVQMAQALVEKTAELTAAQTERQRYEDLQKESEQQRQAAEGELKSVRNALEQESKTLAKLQDAHAKSESQAADKLREQVAAAENKISNQFKKQLGDRDKEVNRLQSELSTIEESYKAKLQEHVQAYAALKSAQAAKETANQEGYQQKMASAEQELSSKYTKMIEEKDAKLERLQAEWQSQLKQLESDKDATIQELKSRVQTLESDSQTLLEGVKAEAQKEWEIKVAAIVTQKDDRYDQLQMKFEKVNKENYLVMLASEQLQEEVDIWRETFDNRTYCNTTMIANDFYDASAVAYQRSFDFASSAGHSVVEHSKQAAAAARVYFGKFLESAKVYGEKAWQQTIVLWKQTCQSCNKFYETNWPKVQPHYEKHVQPLLDKAQDFTKREIKPRWKEVENKYMEVGEPKRLQVVEFYHGQFDRVVKLYATHCPTALNMVREWSQKNGQYERLEEVQESMEYSCNHPVESVTLLQRSILVLLALPWIPMLLGWIFGLLRMTCSIVVAVTPLRFIVRRRGVGPRKTVKSQKAAPSKKKAREQLQ